jgi:LytS/YehU family sensor histidine kinase
LSGVLSSIVLYATILAISYVLDARARLARQQTETARLNELLTKAQLDALRHQIEPHFLFNTLNSIAGLVRENRNDDAVNMIAGLSDFLRRVLENSGQSGSSQQVPLAEELEFAQRYLDIQKVRFADRLSLSVNVPADLLNARVPSLILQPMVENAIKHGIAKRAQGGEVRIAAARSNGRLTLSVYNDGPGLTPPGGSSAPGIGIANTRARLTSLYGSDFDLSLRNLPPAGVEAFLSVPFSLAASPASATASRHE